MFKSIVCFLFAGALLSAAPVNVTLVDAGNGVNDGHYYVGPYTLNVDGEVMKALCIDPTHESDPGNQWLANLTNLSAASSAVPGLSNTYLGNAGLQKYEEEAYLFNLITAPGVTNSARITIQHAMWNIVDPGFAPDASAQSYIDQAEDNLGSINPHYYTIVSDVNHQYQEFMVADAPEPASFGLLGLAVFGLGLTQFRKRRFC